MIKIYVTLIKKGLKTLEDIPNLSLRKEVKKILNKTT